LLRRGLRSTFDEFGVDAIVTGFRSVIQVHFGTQSVDNRRDLLRSDLRSTTAFLLGLVAEGVLWPPVHPAVTSGAHTPEHIELVLDRVQSALRRMT
jgi:glutamate-1-semialdehyde 2,1-aminomutase